ncbi:hypothetical protein [Microvirga massiliensis]|uniref:hypothetical protein n=1 Tax=Microvirga massiliensis TaxID=1033741 RepID=UPI0011C8B17B|nr:hypothetical protein [Microvirga massiliensis]
MVMKDASVSEREVRDLVSAADQRKLELLDTPGKLFSEEQVAARLGLGIRELRERTSAGRLIAILIEGAPRYPACQFDEHGIVAGLEMALSLMPIQSNWMRLEWLLTPDEVLDDLSPLAVLKMSRREDIITAARAHGGD